MVSDDYQFGFKSSHSTAICTSVFKQVVDYYTDRGSHVFACFVDFSKAFDRVNYWKLFSMLLDDGVDKQIVKLLCYWYSHQHKHVFVGKTVLPRFSQLGMEQDKEESYHLYCLRGT